MIRERFAPSPTGLLHLGHAYSALLAWDAAKPAGGQFLVRIEDTDTSRCNPEYEQNIFDDLSWLGLSWEQPVMRQSNRMSAYQLAMDKLIALDLCYPCKCSRKDISAALSAPQEGADPVFGPDGPIYPGTCAQRSMSERTPSDAIRLNMRRALTCLGGSQAVNDLSYIELGTGEMQTISLDADALENGCGDIVLTRKDSGTSYHLAVVVDDAHQRITHVTRGADIAPATQIHRLLQALLGLPTPIYRHHKLIRDENGKRLAKRFDAMAISKYRQDGFTPQDIRHMVGLP